VKLDLSGVEGDGTLEEKDAEQERPYPAAESGQDCGTRAERLKPSRAGRESEGFVVPKKAARNRWREGTLL